MADEPERAYTVVATYLVPKALEKDIGRNVGQLMESTGHLDEQWTNGGDHYVLRKHSPDWVEVNVTDRVFGEVERKVVILKSFSDSGTAKDLNYKLAEEGLHFMDSELGVRPWSTKKPGDWWR